MKKVVVVIIWLLCLVPLIATNFPARITSFNPQKTASDLNALGISIDNVKTDAVIVYVSVAQYDDLRSMGYQIIEIPNEAKIYADKLWEETKNTRNPLDQYYSYDEYVSFMQSTAAAYPSICRLVNAGQTVQGRQILFMEISDNVNVEENEPEFRYVSSMHGDEVTGYDMCIRLIQYLTSQYGTNSRITDMVNNTEIWINPLFNPDGYVLHQRENANDVDLNRHFPDYISDPNNTTTGRELEIQVQMNFALQHTFNLSGNFHGGSLVANYPWDKTYTLAPDDALLQQLALSYTSHNQPMYDSSEFTHGITNGAAWYVVNGGFQDWTYYYHHTMDITYEISEDKWPSTATLPTFWNQNRESMLSYIENVQKGIHGLVTNSQGQPLAADIVIAGIDNKIATDPDVGDYHRILLPGTYTMTVSSLGYIPQTLNNIVVPSTGHTTVNVTLLPAQTTSLEGHVVDYNHSPIVGAQILVDGTTTLTSDNNGHFVMASLLEGTHTITVTATGMAPVSMPVNVSVPGCKLVVPMTAPLFSDNFENGISAWTTTGTWAISVIGTNHVLTDSPTGLSGNNINTYAKLTNPISTQNMQNVQLGYDLKYSTEAGYDFIKVEGSTNGSSWTQLASYDGAADWAHYTLSLPSGVSQLYIRFHLTTDNNTSNDGAFFDNVTISGTNSNQVAYGDVNADQFITTTDAAAILEYSVGNDPLSSIDPLPWTAERFNIADTDNNNKLQAYDAAFVLASLYSNQLQYPVMNSTLSTTGAIVQASVQNRSIVLSFTPTANAASLQVWLPTSSNGTYGEAQWSNENVIATATGTVGTEKTWAGIFSASNPSPVTLTIPVTSYQSTILPVKIVSNADSSVVSLDWAVGNEDLVEANPLALSVYPNPFSSRTTIQFNKLRDDSQETIQIYNLKGQLVKNLSLVGRLSGTQSIQWDGTDNNAHSVAAGVYFVQLHNSKGKKLQKLLLLK